MSGLRVTVSYGVTTHRAELPADVPISRLLPVLLHRLQIPSRAPDGSSLYAIFLRGRQLDERETLEAAGVTNEEMLELRTGFRIDLAERRPNQDLPILTKGIQSAPTSVSIPIVEELSRSLLSVLNLHYLALGPENEVRVSLWDMVSVCVRPSIMLPSDIQMRLLLPALAEATGARLHIENVDVCYELRLRSGKVLRDGETLTQSGVDHGDTLFFLLTENRDRAAAAAAGWTCRSCTRQSAEAWPFCPACGAVNPAFCARCSQRIPDYSDILFCPSCGKRLS